MTTVSMRFARQCAVVQVASSEPIPIGYTPLNCGVDEYTLYECMFWGFTGRTRTKLKKFRSIQHAFAYLNKLHAGGWMDTINYDIAWTRLLQLAWRVNVDVFSDS